MGSCHCSAIEVVSMEGCCREVPVDGLVPFKGTGGDIHALILALDYEYSAGKELSCTNDGQAVLRICQRAGVKDITVVTDQHIGQPGFPVRRLVLHTIREVAARCQEGDWFFWFFAGHGVNVPDVSGDDVTGLDQAFVLPDKEGQLTEKSVLIDDDFARALDHYIPDGVRILCVCDCCHSGTICDIDSYLYKHEIYQISASKDEQEAVDTGRGGVLTESLRRTVREMSVKYSNREFSVQTVFDRCKQRATRLTKMQDLMLQFNGLDPRFVAWPLCFPWMEYLKEAKGDLEEFEYVDSLQEET